MFFLKVPSSPSFLKITNPTLDSLTLEWGSPTHPNGVLISYTLKFQPSKLNMNIFWGWTFDLSNPFQPKPFLDSLIQLLT